MLDLVTLIKTFGPLMGLTLFMIWKQLQIGSTLPRFEAIDKKLDEILRKLNHESTDEPHDTGSDLPVEEAVR